MTSDAPPRPAPDCTQTALATSEALFSSAFAHLPDATLIVDARGRILTANRLAEALLDQDTRMLQGLPGWGFLAPKWRDALASRTAPPSSETAAITFNGHEVELAYASLGADGDPTLIRVRPLRGGQPVASICSVAGEDSPTEAPFVDIVDSVPAQMWSAHPDGRILFVNARWQAYTGLSTAAALDWGWRDAIHPEDIDAYLHALSAIRASRQAGEAEARLRRHDGVYRWFMMRISPVQDDAGNIIQWCGANTDIESSKRVEAALRHSEAFLAEAQSLSRTGSFGWNTRDDTLYWSSETFCILGYEQSINPSLEAVLHRTHPEDVFAVQAALQQSRGAGSSMDLQHRLLLPDGSIRHVHALAHASLGPAGDKIFVGAIMDITDRKHSEAALLQAQIRFEGILDIAEDAIISTDAQQRIVLFNQGAVRMFGYDSEEILGKSLDGLLPKHIIAAHRQHMASFAQGADTSRAMARRREVYGRRRNGQEFPADATISRLDLDTGPIFTVILRDISERKQLMEEILASERVARGQAEALTGVLDVLAHESDPERIAEHLLRTLTDQLEAQSSSVWLKDETGQMSFAFALEHDQFKTRDDPVLMSVSPTLSVDEVWPWPEVFRTRKAFLLEDIRHGPDFPWRDHVVAQGIISILIVPMVVSNEVAGVIGVRFAQRRHCSEAEIALAQALANQSMLAVALNRLMSRTRETSVLKERNRIARDLHDTIAQGLTGIVVQLEATADAFSRGLLAEADGHAARARELARGSLQDARRAVHALRPRALEDKDLCEAFRQIGKEMTRGTNTRFDVSLTGRPIPLPARWEENILRIGQEAMTNAIRHAAAAHVLVRMTFGPNDFTLHIRDDGTGFSPARRHDGFGLQGIAERVDEMGGHMQIDSTPGAGSEIAVTLPISDLGGAGATRP